MRVEIVLNCGSLGDEMSRASNSYPSSRDVDFSLLLDDAAQGKFFESAIEKNVAGKIAYFRVYFFYCAQYYYRRRFPVSGYGIDDVFIEI